MHCSGWTGNGVRIIEIWVTREQFDRFVESTLMPIVMEVSADDTREPVVTSYELHSLMTA
jgi:hypothetical protein